MRNLPFDRPGRFWRGNLHTHSTCSDGTLSPADACRLYREAGYDFVAITDHFRAKYGYPLTDTRPLRSPGFTTLLGAELHAPGVTVPGGPATDRAANREWHIVAAGLPPGFAPPGPRESGPELARRARAAGAFVGMAHPAASLLTLADAQTLDAAHAVEVYNALAAHEDRADSWHLTDVLLSRGHRLGAYAADDAHFQSRDPRPCAAWVQVRAESLDPAALVAALRAGHYYASTGPLIHEIGVDDGRITVGCSPAARVIVTGSVPGKRVTDGTELTACTLPLDMFANSPYIRVTVVDAAGGRAWTNPIWLG